MAYANSITWSKASSNLSSMAHTTQIDLGSILAQQNPQIDLRLPAYEASTRNFLKAVSNYSNRAIGEITKRKEKYALEKKKLADKTVAVESETNQCKVKEIELVATLEREREEKSEAEQSVAAYKRQLASLREKCASIDVEIEQYRAITANLRRGVYSVLYVSFFI
jgi:kinetochore protein Spc25